MFGDAFICQPPPGSRQKIGNLTFLRCLSSGNAIAFLMNANIIAKKCHEKQDVDGAIGEL